MQVIGVGTPAESDSAGAFQRNAPGEWMRTTLPKPLSYGHARQTAGRRAGPARQGLPFQALSLSPAIHTLTHTGQPGSRYNQRSCPDHATP
jgi:hypothetical protein